jgi:quercetin dioxygenase-like cupin family protein
MHTTGSTRRGGMTTKPVSQVRDPVSRVRQAFASDGETLIVDNWLEPGAVLPPHFHPQQEERWSVLAGAVLFRYGDEERLLGPEHGEVLVGAGVVHGLRNTGAEEAHLRCLVTPALRLRQFLEEAAAAGQQGLFTQSGRPRGIRGARWAARFLKRYRDETVFLSPPPLAQRILIAVLARDG